MQHIKKSKAGTARAPAEVRFLPNHLPGNLLGDAAGPLLDQATPARRARVSYVKAGVEGRLEHDALGREVVGRVDGVHRGGLEGGHDPLGAEGLDLGDLTRVNHGLERRLACLFQVGVEYHALF